MRASWPMASTQLGRRVVRHDERRALRDGRVIHLAQDIRRARTLVAEGNPGDESVGIHRVFDGETLTQELRVPHQCGTSRCEALGEPGGRPDRHGGLSRHDVSGSQVGDQGVDRSVDIRHVCGVAILLLGRADTDEVHLRAVGLCHVGGETQSTRRDAIGEYLGKARFEEGRLALRQ